MGGSVKHEEAPARLDGAVEVDEELDPAGLEQRSVLHGRLEVRPKTRLRYPIRHAR